MNDYQVLTIESSKKQLVIVLLNLGSIGPFNDIEKIVKPVFSELAPFLTRKKQVLYIRDIPKYAIDGKYVGGNAYIDCEAQISTPVWPADVAQMTGSIAHELHHLARWQTVGYGKTLGEAITSEGFASMYAQMKSHLKAPWTQTIISDEIKQKALREWDSQKYNHYEWFYKSKLGRWIGYSIGYQLIHKQFGNNLDIRQSLFVTSGTLKELLKKK
jgi:hypothetical protein